MDRVDAAIDALGGGNWPSNGLVGQMTHPNAQGKTDFRSAHSQRQTQD